MKKILIGIFISFLCIIYIEEIRDAKNIFTVKLESTFSKIKEVKIF